MIKRIIIGNQKYIKFCLTDWNSWQFYKGEAFKFILWFISDSVGTTKGKELKCMVSLGLLEEVQILKYWTIVYRKRQSIETIDEKILKDFVVIKHSISIYMTNTLLFL